MWHLQNLFGLDKFWRKQIKTTQDTTRTIRRTTGRKWLKVTLWQAINTQGQPHRMMSAKLPRRRRKQMNRLPDTPMFARCDKGQKFAGDTASRRANTTPNRCKHKQIKGGSAKKDAGPSNWQNLTGYPVFWALGGGERPVWPWSLGRGP